MKTYDLLHDKGYQEAVARFGGEEYLKENYPLIHRVFQNSRKYTQCNSFSLRRTNDTATIGRQDIMASYLVENAKTPESPLQQVTHYNFQEQKACVIVDTTIEDESGKVYGSMTNLVENTYANDVTNDIKGIIMDHPYNLKLKTVITSFTIDQETGAPVAKVSEPIQKNEAVLICSAESVIKSVKVHDPVNKYPKSDVTYIVYGNRPDQNVSYPYPDVPSPKVIGGIKYAEIWCPYKVTVKLDSFTFWEEKPLSTTDFIVSLESMDPEKYGGGGICYNNIKNIKTTLSADKKELTIEISPGWNAMLTVNDINLVIGAFKFYACFKIIYNIKIGTSTMHQLATVITSTDVALTSSTDYVGMIKIRWGCFGKDCIFTTPQGPKKVCDLAVGDHALTVDGSFAKVTNITTGHEQDLINIQLTGHEDVLQLSETHGIETRRGLIPAGDLKFEDEILTADQTYQPPCFIEKRFYDDIVYNVETEAHSKLVVNGMIVSEKETHTEKPGGNETAQQLPKELLAELKQLVEDKNKGRL